MKNTTTGRVLWYDKRDGNGIIVDAAGNEFYTSSDVLIDLHYLDSRDEVTFDHDVKGGTACAFNVALLEGGEHVDCGASDCQDCCQHGERDHGICLDCGHEEDPGCAIDRAMDSMEDR